jgi:hypothetical protein
VGQEEVQEISNRVNNADAPGLEGESQSGGSVFFELLSGLGWFSPDLSLLIVARTLLDGMDGTACPQLPGTVL